MMPLPIWPPGFLGHGVTLSQDVELRTSFQLPGGRMVHVPLSEVESIEAGFRAGEVDRDGEWRQYVVSAFGKRVDVEIGWGHDSYAVCTRPNGLTPDQESVVEAVIKRLADEAFDSACEVEP